jgi:LacI family transcriptional regulator
MAPDVAVDSLSDHLPLVLLNSSDRRHAAITIDNFGGARTMMRHLTSLGHRRIAFITGPAQNADARERLRGYRHSMRGSNGEAVEVRGDFSEDSGHAAADEIAKMDPRPTAIFAANDSMAIGALSALSEGGWSVPDDITVVGFDDIPIARYVSPQLTTIRVDIVELGRRAFAVLLDALSRDALSRPSADGVNRRERITTNLIVRRSCAAPATSRTGKRAKGEKS